MYPPDSTPYLSQLIEQNTLIRERNDKLEAQNEIFKTFLQYNSPGVSFEGDDVFTILKTIYINGRKLYDLLSENGSESSKVNLRDAQLLCGHLTKSIDILSRILPETNYFHRDYPNDSTTDVGDAGGDRAGTASQTGGINKVLYTVCQKIEKWKLTHWNTNASTTADQISSAYAVFLALAVADVLISPEAWHIRITRA